MSKIKSFLKIILINIIILFVFLFIIFNFNCHMIKNNKLVIPKYIKSNSILIHYYYYLYMPNAIKKLVKLMDSYDINIKPVILDLQDSWFMSKDLYHYIPRQNLKDLMWYKPNMQKLAMRFPVQLSDNEIYIVLSINVINKPGLKEKIINLARETLCKDYFNDYFVINVENFDEYGFRKTGFDQNTKNLPNVLFVGDSYTEGLFIADGDTFAHFAGKKLIANSFGFPKNGGVNGFGTDEVADAVDNYAQHVKPKMIIYTHALNDLNQSNDICNNLLMGTLPTDQKQNLWNKSFKYIDKLNDYCEQNNIVFIITPFPDCAQFLNYYEWGDSTKNYQKVLGDYCRKKNIHFVDFYKDFKNNVFDFIQEHSERDDFDDNGFFKEELHWDDLYEDTQQGLYIYQDGHLSETGHEFFGELLADYLLNNFKKTEKGFMTIN